MITYINIIFTLFLLLPGFISLKIRQSTKEYKELTTFEYTSISIGFSFLIFIFWIIFNYLITSFSIFQYTFFSDLEKIVTTENQFSILFTSFFFIFISSYLVVFAAFSLIIYNFHWIGLWNIILRKLGLTRFSSHLTPWEDFQIISKLDWIIVELKDKRRIVGKLGFGSHLPFDREIVLKRTDISPIEIYDEHKNPIDYKVDIGLTYINYSEINTIHAVKDESIEISHQTILDYSLLFLSLIVACISIFTFSIFVILKIDSNYTYSLCFDLLMLAISIISITLNLKTLSKFT